MITCEHDGSFSLDTSVRIEVHDRQGLERLLRYCARPAFAQERLRQLDPEHLVYESKKPGPGGKVNALLTPHQLPDRLSALMPLAATPASLLRRTRTEFSIPASGDGAGRCGISM